MRPIRLEMEGFATFRTRTVLDFDGIDLVAFTGPTGAGKSTVIDAITFALYGSVARYDNPNLVAPVIHQLANEAKVRLDFEVGDVLYSAVRVVRRTKTGASTREARLQRYSGSAAGADSDADLDDLLDDTNATVEAGSVGELDAAVVELLGLDFTQFTRTIVLPQGEFAQFLRDEPANRQKLLRRLLDLEIYNRMGIAARDEAKRAAQQLETVEAERDRHQPLDDAAMEALTTRADAIAALRTDLAGRLGELTALEARLVPLRERCTVIDQTVERLRAVSMPDGIDDLGRRLDQARADRDTAAEALDTVRERRNQAQQALADLVAKVGDRAGLTGALATLQQRAEAVGEQTELTDRLAALADAEQRLEAEADRARQAVEAAEQALSTARRTADAAHWVDTLVVGEPCPVCRQTVDAIPDHDGDQELDELAQRHRAAADASRSADRELADARAGAKAARSNQESLRARLEAMTTKLTASFGSSAPEPNAIEADLAALADLERARDEVATTVGEAEQALSMAERAVASVADGETRARAELSSARDTVAAHEPPVLDGVSVVDDWETLTTWAGKRADELATERVELADEGKRLAQEKQSLDAALRAEAARFDIDEPADRLAEALATAEATDRARITAALDRRANHDRLAAQAAELAEIRAVSHALGQHLRSNNFEGWLLDEALDVIVDRATGWLIELSRGQYSLVADERQFAIVDHTNAEDRRDVRTLSGGETFLASLALALALADSVAELAPVDAPRLESMFLDEGFGTLDPETLDVVASAIEELAATGRMIGIVTHVADLAQRMPVRFEVTKQATGSVVELVGA